MGSNFERLREDSNFGEVTLQRVAGGLFRLGSCGARQMCGPPKTYRLTIGLFNEIWALNDALSDLAAQGMHAPSLCLFGQAEHLNAKFWRLDPGQENAGFQSIFEDVREFDGWLGEMSCVASAGPLLDDLCGASFASNGDGQDHPGWLTEAQYGRLLDHIRNGGLMLIVGAETPAQQDASCRALLRHSQHGVQTHDFTLRTAETAQMSPAKGSET